MLPILLLHQGYLGVALFMIVSGLILAVISHEKEIDVPRFYLNRVLHIYRLHIVGPHDPGRLRLIWSDVTPLKSEWKNEGRYIRLANVSDDGPDELPRISKSAATQSSVFGLDGLLQCEMFFLPTGELRARDRR